MRWNQSSEYICMSFGSCALVSTHIFETLFCLATSFAKSISVHGSPAFANWWSMQSHWIYRCHNFWSPHTLSIWRMAPTAGVSQRNHTKHSSGFPYWHMSSCVILSYFHHSETCFPFSESHFDDSLMRKIRLSISARKWSSQWEILDRNFYANSKLISPQSTFE